MGRAYLTALAALLLLSASKPPSVDYRLGIGPVVGGMVSLDVVVQLRGDADGETSLSVPAGLSAQPVIKGARQASPQAGDWVLRHRPGAKLKVRYRVPAAASGPAALVAVGEAVFAAPVGRDTQAATFSWGTLPPGWMGVSDLEHGALGQTLTVADVRPSVVAAGQGLRAVAGERGLRVVVLGDAIRARALIAVVEPVITAQRAFWRAPAGPYLVVAGPFTGGPSDRGGDALTLAEGALADPALRGDIARAQLGAWIPSRLGREPSVPWIEEGLRDVMAQRLLLGAGLTTPQGAVAELADADRGGRRGALLALKWDEEIRKATAGKADLDDVLLRMRDHYQQFAPGQGPDVVTGLVSAAWVVAKLDLRPDIARYAASGGVVELPAEMFDGCLQARVTVSPGFDAGFDAEGSFAARTARRVRARGPAWNSGLRNGMRLEAWTYKAGDMTRQIELTVRPAQGQGRARRLAYWPYGEADVRTRRLQLTPGMTPAQTTACGRKIAGL